MLASDILKENGFNGVTSLITGYIESSWEVNKSEIKNFYQITLKFLFIHINYTIFI